jgi:hypothetical protein
VWIPYGVSLRTRLDSIPHRARLMVLDSTHHEPPNTSHFSMPSASRTRSMSATRSQVVFSRSSAVLLCVSSVQSSHSPGPISLATQRPCAMCQKYTFPTPHNSRLAAPRTALVHQDDAVHLGVKVDRVGRRRTASGTAMPVSVSVIKILALGHLGAWERTGR